MLWGELYPLLVFFLLVVVAVLLLLLPHHLLFLSCALEPCKYNSFADYPIIQHID
jgi:hypothetical protein